MSRRITERDLRHDADPGRFGEAMLRCRNASGDCVASGYCIYGDCFDTRGHIHAAKTIERLIPNPCPRGSYYAYLRKCAEMLRADQVFL